MSAIDEDPDVANERRRVLHGAGRNDLLRLENLTKVRTFATRGPTPSNMRCMLGTVVGFYWEMYFAVYESSLGRCTLSQFYQIFIDNTLKY